MLFRPSGGRCTFCLSRFVSSVGCPRSLRFPGFLPRLAFGSWAWRILHDEKHRCGLIGSPSGWSEADGAVGNLFTFLFEDGIREGQEICPGHCPKNLLEMVSADFVSRIELRVQLARRS